MIRVALALAFALAATASAQVAVPRPDPERVEAGGAASVYYEVRTPVGRPRGVVLAIPGGGWCGATEPENRECGPVEDRIRDDQPDGGYSNPNGGRVFSGMPQTALAAGYVAVSASYASDEPGLADVVAFYDQAAERWPGLPIFAWGQSAGGHWALVLGALRPLAGVIGEAAPADFRAWERGEQGSVFINQYLPVFFGAPDDPEPNLVNYDPGRLYPRAQSPVLLLTAEDQDDAVVPEPVARAFAGQVPGTRVETVGKGDLWWVHSEVDLDGLVRMRKAAVEFLGRLAEG